MELQGSTRVTVQPQKLADFCGLYYAKQSYVAYLQQHAYKEQVVGEDGPSAVGTEKPFLYTRITGALMF